MARPQRRRSPRESRRESEITNIASAQQEGAFHKYAQGWFDAGWYPFPLPPGKKSPPPEHVTGWTNPIDREAWERLLVRWLGNADLKSGLGLRLPEGIIGFDLDAYKPESREQLDKFLAAINADALAPAPCISARGDGLSGTYFYRVPKGVRYPGNLGIGIEFIQHGHRYSVGPGSVHESLGSYYLSYRPGAPPDGYGRTAPIALGEIPEYPELLGYLGSSRYITDLPVKEFNSVRKARLAVQRWVAAHDGPLCTEMSGAVERLADRQHGAAHEPMTAATWYLPMLAIEGHSGLSAALGTARELFLAEAGRDGRAGKSRAAGEPEEEWNRALDGAVRKMLYQQDLGAVEFAQRPDCYCLEVPTEPAEEHEIGYFARHRDPYKYDPTDLGLAEHLLDLHYGDIAFQPDLERWIEWNGERWEVPESIWPKVHAVSQRIGTSMDKIREQQIALAERGEDDAAARLTGRLKALGKAREHAQSALGVKRILSMAEHDPAICYPSGTFDVRSELLGVRNGLLVLGADGSVELRPAERSDRITRCAEASYRARATHPAFEFYLDFFLPDFEVRRELQKFLGYALHGKNPEKLIGVFLGTGNTGKTTLLEWITSALGGYGGSFTSSLFRTNDDDRPRPDVLFAKRFRIAVASEFSEGTALHAVQIKRLTGEESVPVRALYSNRYDDSTPDFTPIIATNSIPRIKDADQALRNRLLVFSFDRVLPARHPEARSKQEIAALGRDSGLLSAVLSWAVDGWPLYVREGFDRLPEKMVDLANEFMSGTGHFQEWFLETFVRDPRGWVPAKAAWDSYRGYCDSYSVPMRDRVQSQTKLGRKLTDAGMTPGRRKISGKTTAIRVGFRWREEENG
jgi:putative DNA primase/helicase